MTKRISQPTTVVVPVSQAPAAVGAAVAAKAVATPAEAAAAVKADVVVEKAPATVTVVADPAMALVAPAPLAMVAEPAAASTTAAAAAQDSDDDADREDMTAYIVGGVLIAGGILAVALSSGDDKDFVNPPIPPAPTPPPTNTVTFSSAGTATIAENSAPTTTIIDVNAAATQTGAITYTLGGTDAALFNIDPATGIVTLKTSANFEAKPSYTITVTASSAGTPAASATQTIVVTVSNVNEAPTFTSATVVATPIAENAAVTAPIFTAAATDPDAGTTLIYSLGGADAAFFTINSATGAVSLRAPANFEAKPSYTFTVTASDAATGGLSATQTVTLNVTNVNEAPTVTVPAAAVNVAENTPATTAVFTATAADVDAGATRTFALTGPDAALFAIDQNGVVTFRASPNFEAVPTKTSFNVSVTVTDQGGLVATSAPVTINVTNVNEAPTFAAATRTTTVAENIAAGSVVVAAGGATDPDAGATITYSLTGTDASLFTVNPTTGAVTLTASPNFEAKPSYSFNLVATDQGGLSTTQANTLTITNVNEAPTFAAGTRTAAVDENVAIGTVVPGSAVATDPDANTTLTYSLSGADAASFTINPTTGVVALAVSPDFETKPVFNFNVVASDGALTATQAVRLNINDLPEGVRIDGGTIPATTQVTYSAAVGNVTFLETGAAGNLSTITNFTAGDIISTDVATSNYSFTSNGTTLIISFNNNGVISRIDLPNSISSNAGVFNEASAEAALGFDFFRSSAPAPTAATLSLDGQTTVNATTNAFTFTDSAAVPNTTAINGFTADDRIVVSGTTSASFSSLNDDLIISFTSGGVVSRITINDVVSPNAGIFDEASAEAAVGFDFFRFG